MKIGIRKTLVGLALSVLAACSSLPAPEKGPAAGVGLSAEYFFGAEFKGPAFTQVSSKVSFNWGQIAPVLGMRPGNFSVRLSGFIQPEFSEDYTFYIPASGEAKLWLDGQAVASGASIKLQAGKRYGLRLEFRKTAQVAALGLEWSSPSTRRALVPQNRLYPAQQTSKVQALAVPEGQNLLLNGDFEQDTGGWLTAAGEANPLTPGRSGGGKAVSVEDLGWLQQDLPFSSIEPGKTYTLEVWGKSVSGQACRAGIGGGTSDGTGFQQQLEFSGDWEKKTLNLTLPTGSAWLAVFLTSSSTDCYYDDVSLTGGIEPPPPTPIGADVVSNGNFAGSFGGWEVFGEASIANGGLPSPSAYGKPGAWIQQNLDMTKIQAGETYVLQASILPENSTGGSCTVGLVAGTPERVLLSRALIVNSFRNTWETKTLSALVPSETTWVAIYLAVNNWTCEFDNIRLSGIHSPDITEPASNPAILSGQPNQVYVFSIRFRNDAFGLLTYQVTVTGSSHVQMASKKESWVLGGKEGKIDLKLTCPASEVQETSLLTITSNDPDEPSKTVTIKFDCLRAIQAEIAFSKITGQQIDSIAWSPDGKRIATAGNKVIVWDSSSGQDLVQFEGSKSVAWSPDGVSLVTAYGEYASIRNASTGEEIRQLGPLPGIFNQIGKVDWSPDGQRIAIACSDQVGIYNAITGTEIVRFTAWDTNTSLTDLEWSPDSSKVVTTSDDAVIWNASTGAELLRLRKVYGPIAWSPDGTQLAGVSFPTQSTAPNSNVRIFDSSTGNIVRTLSTLTNPSNVVWNRDKVAVAADSSDGSGVKIYLFSASTKALLNTFPVGFGTYAGNTPLDWKPEGTQLASVLKQRGQVLDVNTGQVEVTLGFHGGGAFDFNDKNYLLSAGDSAISWLDLTSGNTLGLITTERYKQLQSVKWIPSSNSVAAVYQDYSLDGVWKLRSWDIQTKNSLVELTLPNSPIVAWSPDGQHIAVAGTNGPIKIFDTTRGIELLTLEDSIATYPSDMSWSPDDSRIAVSRGKLTVWNAQTGVQLHQFDLMSGVPIWSPDSKKLAGHSKIIDADSGKIILSSTKLSHPLIWSPNSMRVATIYRSNIEILSISTGVSLYTFPKRYGGSHSMAWSPDGLRFLASSTGQLDIWRVNFGPIN